MTINKQVLQLISMPLVVGSEMGLRVASAWEETRVPIGNPHVWVGEH